MKHTITDTNFYFPKQKSVYKGKVRDVYNINDEILVMIVSDRLSAFDVVMPKGVPYKGQVLNQIAQKFMNETKDIVSNWIIAHPDINVTIGHLCKPFKVEMVVRGYLSGHAWRVYQSGKRVLCGVTLPEELKENDKLPSPIITPTTKADLGQHDEDVSEEEILEKNILSPVDYQQLKRYTYALFERGTQIATRQNLILVDAKYEFGKTKDGKIVLIDEIHTPDSSRYFYKEGYLDRQDKGLPQKQLSKEFVRQWLISNNFQGKKGQEMPIMTDEFINMVSHRYIELYENITGDKFIPSSSNEDPIERIEKNVLKYFHQIKY